MVRLGLGQDSGHCRVADGKNPHHKRTRLSGEQQGITVKAAATGEAAPWLFAQVSI
ncbi:hypothetical protein ACIQUX_29230 [Streptomyces sp. NPDC101133]|uniref:hypothetical protein n=1 Tax=Streptomyces sp. NPDC101133 TaxID=3366111 RepID=UPI0038265BDF